jgi:integrase
VRSSIDLHIAGSRLGGMRLGAVRPSDVQAWATERAQQLAPLTTRNLLGLLRSVFASAVLDRLIASSPVVRVQLPGPSGPRVVPLTVEQVQALAAAMPDRHRGLVIVQAALGLRLGELLALRVEDVDFLRRVVHVRSQFASGIRERVEPKTPRSKRDVPLPQVAADAIAAHLARYAAAEDGTIFTGANGLPHRGDWYGTRVFRRAVEAAGLPKGTTSHDLRHHYASVLLAAGESVVAVAERLGHDDAALVLKTYGHLMPDSDDRTRSAIDAP